MQIIAIQIRRRIDKEGFKNITKIYYKERTINKKNLKKRNRRKNNNTQLKKNELIFFEDIFNKFRSFL